LKWFTRRRIRRQENKTSVEISIFVGEWIQALSNRMSNAVDGDCFLLPTPMHLHAFETLQEQEQFVGKNFKVKVASTRI